ncbi:MAG: ADP-dependent NAD(P)H-hydrate dehydratase [Pseudonocardiales bacterium]|nr:ADP-dependent NAD(P)H-hydrate dehydratase [Pseudonocardiales bacterium]MDT4942114.1 ADP-dependent NAD(P)H-hydrate dehydratase [Pseudonocardiales bacterium]
MTEQPTDITPELLRQWPLPDPGNSKHSRGHVLVLGGARATPGAAALAGLAALRVGAGVLAMAVPPAVAVPLAVALPEASVTGWGGRHDADVEDTVVEQLLDSADAVAVGPGLDSSDIARRLVDLVARSDADFPVVLDAYALGVLDDVRDGAERLAGRLVLTPNQQEAELLLDGAAEGLPDIELALQIARRWSAVVSCYSAVATPAGRVYRISSGNAGLGTSGSGDVLAGAVAGLLARGVDAEHAACWGNYAHARAGDRLAARMGGVGFLARELLDELPIVLGELHD